MKESSQPAEKRRGMIAWAFYDWGQTAFSTVIQTFIFAAYFAREIAPDQASGTTYWGTAIGVSGIFVAVLGPVLGAIADQKGQLKPWIAGFTLLCVMATAGLWFARPSEDWLLYALILVGIGSLSSEFALIFYNSMLTSLAPPERRGLWSGWGWGLGYAGGLCCLLSIWFGFLGENPLFALEKESGQPVRAACLFTAGWLLLFSLPLLLFTSDEKSHGKTLKQAASDGITQLKQSLKNVRKYREILKFLIAHMLYIDALAAIFVMGGVFAASLFGMDEQQILLFGITLNVSAGIGAISFAWVDKHLGAKPTILLSLAGLIIFSSLMIFVAETITLFWVFGLILGLFVGPAHAASRSYLSLAAPAALQSQMFGLYALSGKATAFIGPLLVAGITQISDSQRFGMSVLIVLFILGFLVLLTIPSAQKVSAGKSM